MLNLQNVGQASQLPANSAQERSDGQRVCDQCMIKKTKCNRLAPCSRCMENDWVCTYSVKKRKPGPIKGSAGAKRRKARTEDDCENSQPVESMRSAVDPAAEVRNFRSSVSFNPAPSTSEIAIYDAEGASIPDIHQCGTDNFGNNAALSSSNEQTSPLGVFQLSLDTENNLIHLYLANIQPLYPLFQRTELIGQVVIRSLPTSLLSALIAVAVPLSTDAEIIILGPHKVADAYASLAWKEVSSIFAVESSTDPDDLRTLFLLALYESRKTPSSRAWAAIGHLVRLGYHCGIHQVDNTVNCRFYKDGQTTPAERESWRYLWWSIYIWDTCSNTLAATPSSIDLDSLCTALPAGTIAGWTEGRVASPLTRTFLSGNYQEMLKVLSTASSHWLDGHEKDHDLDVNFTIRIINTYLIREAASLQRVISHNPMGQFESRKKMLAINLASTRMALPQRYLDPPRRVSHRESKEEHNLRVINLLEISLNRKPITDSKVFRSDDLDDAWLRHWDVVMMFPQDVVQIFQSWDPAMSSMMDTCIAYTIFAAIVMLDIDTKLECPGRSIVVQDVNNASIELLYLFLRHLCQYWELPKALIGAAERFQKIAVAPLSPKCVIETFRQDLQNIQKLISQQPEPGAKAFDISDSTSQFPQDFDFQYLDSLPEWFSVFDGLENNFSSM